MTLRSTTHGPRNWWGAFAPTLVAVGALAVAFLAAEPAGAQPDGAEEPAPDPVAEDSEGSEGDGAAADSEPEDGAEDGAAEDAEGEDGAEDSEPETPDTKPAENTKAKADEAPAVDASAVVHGSGGGNKDSRGPGGGNGRGRPAPAEVEVGDKPEQPPATIPKESSPLAIRLNDDFTLVPSLSYWARYYHREGRDFVAGGNTNAVRHRARLGLKARYRQLAEVFVQLQDVRTFGEETDPTGDFSAGGFDLHQGYFTLKPGANTRIRVGRQEVDLANERLVGRPLFLEQSRSFDGAHFRYDKKVELEAGYFLVRDYGVTPGDVAMLPSGKRHLGIGHLGYEMFQAFHPHIVTVLDGDTATERVVVTVGGLVTGSYGDSVKLSYSAEGYYQGGKDAAVNVSAWLAGLSTRLDTPLYGTPFAQLEAVLVSGDEQPDDPTANSFASPFPRGHRIHGEMDLFINFPRDTDARGLRDLGGTLGWSPEDVNLTADFHFFDAMASRPDGLRSFGFESDFKVRYPFWEYFSVDALYGFFVPGEIFRVGRIDPQVEHFAYATMRVEL